MTLRPVKTLVGVCFALLMTGTVSAQQPRPADEAFTRGMQSLDDEEWTAAIKHFQDALRLDPKESTRKIGRRIFGIGGSEYLPHVRIGQAYLGMGDCARALAEWEVSQQQGTVAMSEDGTEIIEEGQEECDEMGFLVGPEYRAEVQRVQGILREAAQVDQQLAASSAGRPDLGGDVRSAYDKARTNLNGARAKANEAEQTRKKQTMGEAADAAEDARRLLIASREAFDRSPGSAAAVVPPRTESGPDAPTVETSRVSTAELEMQGLRARAQQAFAAVDGRLTQTRTAFSARPPAAALAQQAAAEMSAAQDRLARARSQFDRAVQAGNFNDALAATRAVADVNDRLDRLAALLAGHDVQQTLPDTLKAAADAFFRGRYDEVARTLTEDAVQSMPSSYRVHALTIRAASLFARYEYSNRRDASLRAAARLDVDASRRLDPAFQPSQDAFSPKFIAFFSEISTASR